MEGGLGSKAGFVAWPDFIMARVDTGTVAVLPALTTTTPPSGGNYLLTHYGAAGLYEPGPG